MFYLFARCAIRLDGFMKQRPLFLSSYTEQRLTRYRDNNILGRDLSARRLVIKNGDFANVRHGVGLQNFIKRERGRICLANEDRKENQQRKNMYVHYCVKYP